MNYKYLKIAVAQLNFCVGDIKGNSQKIIKYIKKAVRRNCDIICFPELSITGYPPEDLLLNDSFVNENIKALNNIKQYTKSITAVIGCVERKNQRIYNSAAIVSCGEIVDIYCKQRLPNYGVFDEKRYFEPDNIIPVYKLGPLRFGVNICEDIWFPGNPTQAQSLLGANFILNISSSPFHASKAWQREEMLVRRAADYNTAIIFCNLVGGQDELLFDGNSCAILPYEGAISRAKAFEEDFLTIDLDARALRKFGQGKKSKISKPDIMEQGDVVIKSINTGNSLKPKKLPAGGFKKNEFCNKHEEILKALTLGTRDYVGKNGFKKVVIGLSGGIDSSLVAVIAVNAVGAKNVVGVSMPSMYSSKGSMEDAEALAVNLGIRLIKVPIKRLYDRYIKDLSDVFMGMGVDETEENIQARIRGNILMALSNKFGWLVLTTANKSETSVGYSTLYGDMAGGFSVIKDVPKTVIYELAGYYNDKNKSNVIPQSVLTKPPSAELRPDQVDTDTLPPYHILDSVLKAYVEDDKSLDDIVRMGFSRKIVKRIITMVDRNEYKRRQSPPGIKITPRAFGRDRRFPLTNRYKY